MIAASDKILEKAWFSGKEIYELYISDKLFQMPEKEVVEKLNAELSDEAFTVTRAEWYSGEIKALRDNFEYVLYSMTFKDSAFSYSSILAEIQKIQVSDFYPVKVKVKSTTQRDVVRVQELNAKDFLYKTFVRKNEDGTLTLFAALSANMAMYDFAATLLHTSKRNLYKYPAVVEEFLIKSDGGSLDMFADTCLECDAEIEENIFGEPISSDYCLEHKYMKQFENKAANVQISDEVITEEDEEDTPFDIGGHDDDDDEDVSDKYEGNEGI